MPTLGAPLDFVRLEARNFRAHVLAVAPPAPVSGQLYFDSAQSILFWWDGTQWVAAGGAAVGGPPTGAAGGSLNGNYPNPGIAPGAVTNTELAAGAAAANLGNAAGDVTGPFSNLQLGPGVVTTTEILNGTITDVDVAAANKDGAAGVPSLRTLGTGATQAAPGNDARFGAGGPPSGAAGGSLNGTYPNPGIAAGAVTDVEVAAANKDGANGTPSMRRLGAGAGQAMAGNTTLNNIPVATGAVNLNGQVVNGVANPVAGTDGANKSYVDNFVQGLSSKASVRVASTAQRALNGLAAIDGVTPVAGDRVLLKNQTAGQENGIYIAAGGAWTRSTDADIWTELIGAFTFVSEGTTQADTGWVSQAATGGTINTTPYTWTQFSAAGAYIGGAGLTLTGNTFDVIAGDGTIIVNPNSIQVGNITSANIPPGTVDLTTDITGTLPIANGGTNSTTAPTARTALGATGKYTSNANPNATTWTIPAATHGLGATQALLVQITTLAGDVEIPDVNIAVNGNVTITWAVAPASGTRQATIIG